MKPSTYCKNCGAYIPDGKKKCLACGFPIITPPIVSKEDEEWFKEHKHLFKPIEGYTEQRRFSWNGYEINENGQVLSIPDDDEIPITTFDDDTIQVIKGKGKVTIKPELGIAEVARNSSFEMWQAKFEERNRKPKEPKPDIDLDDLMEKTFVTVKINDKVSRFYFGDRPKMCVADVEIHGRTMDGRIIGNGIKKKIDFRLIEA